MQMTEDEIRVNYKQAKNKRKQVGILAQLNACSTEEIRRILDEGKTAEPEKPKRTYMRKKKPEEPGQESGQEIQGNPQEPGREINGRLIGKSGVEAVKALLRQQEAASTAAAGEAVRQQPQESFAEYTRKEIGRRKVAYAENEYSILALQEEIRRRTQENKKLEEEVQMLQAAEDIYSRWENREG